MGDYKIDTTGIYFDGVLKIDATKTYTVSGDSVDIDITNIMDLSSNQDISGVKTFLETIIGDLSGNAASATQLETARTIAGVSFDGTSNILSDIKYDSANSRLGIGTTSPSVPLHIHKYDNSDNNIIEMLRLERSCHDIYHQQLAGNSDLSARNAEGGYIGLYVKDQNNGGELARISWRADNELNYEGDGRLGFWTAKSVAGDASGMTLIEHMTIDRDGYVGIGTTSPNSCLEVRKDVTLTTDTTNTAHLQSQFSIGNATLDKGYVGMTYKARGSDNIDIVHAATYCSDGTGNYGTQLYFGIAVTNHSDFHSDSSDIYGVTEGELESLTHLAITHEGKVGIGTTTPKSKLHMNSGVFIAENRDNTNTGMRILYADGSGNSPGEGSSVYTSFANPKFGSGIFVNDAREVGSTITLINKDTSNNLLKHASIGFALTDSPGDSKFGGQIGFWPEITNATKQQFRIYTSGTSAGYNLPVQQMVVTSDGNVGIGTTTPAYNLDVNGTLNHSGLLTNNSDDRLKHNETDISNALQHIRDLHPQHYIKTTNMYDADHHFDLDASGQPINSSGNPVDHFIEEGLIAQDLLQIDAFKPFVSVPTDPTTKPYGVNYNSIFVHAIAALQELDAEHTKTKTELEQTKQSLTETISNLESSLQSALSRITALETQTTS